MDVNVAREELKEALERYFDVEDTYGPRDFEFAVFGTVDSEMDGDESDFAKKVREIVDMRRSKMSFSVSDMAEELDILVNGGDEE